MGLRAEPGSGASDLRVERDAPAEGAAPAPRPHARRVRQPVSLQTRSLAAASIALAASLGLSGFALDQAFYESSLQQLRDRLQGYVWSYLSGSDVTVSGRLVLPEFPPDQRFDRPQSGLYAGVAGKGINWESPSALGRKLPFDVQLEPNQTRFVGPVETNIGGVYVFSQGVDYAYGDGSKSVRLTFHIAEHESALERQMQVFRRTLWTWVVVLGLLLWRCSWASGRHPQRLHRERALAAHALPQHARRPRAFAQDPAGRAAQPVGVRRGRRAPARGGRRAGHADGPDRRLPALARGDLRPQHLRRRAGDRARGGRDRAQPGEGVRRQERAVRVRG